MGYIWFVKKLKKNFVWFGTYKKRFVIRDPESPNSIPALWHFSKELLENILESVFVDSFQPNVAFHIETSHSIHCISNGWFPHETQHWVKCFEYHLIKNKNNKVSSLSFLYLHIKLNGGFTRFRETLLSSNDAR